LYTFSERITTELKKAIRNKQHLHLEYSTDVHGNRIRRWKKDEEFFTYVHPHGFNEKLQAALKAIGGMNYPVMKNGRQVWTWKFASNLLPKVAKILEHVDPAMSQALLHSDTYTGHRAVHEHYKASTAESHIDKPQGTVEIPRGEAAKKKGMDYYDYQKAGVEYILKRDNTLLCDEMGLGKTIQGIGACNVWEPERVLIVCPASVKRNWAKEWKLWNTTKGLEDPVVIQGRGKEIPDKGVVIINYDVLSHYKKKLDAVDWDVQLVDEAHEIKNRDTKRAIALVGHYRKKVKPIPAKKRVYMTGTPIENRPNELWPLLSVLDNEQGGLARQFKRFHIADFNGYGTSYTYDNAKSQELHDKLRSRLMIRRLADDVLDLPPLVEKIIVLDPDKEAKAAMKDDERATQQYATYMTKLAELEKKYMEKESSISEDDEEALKGLTKSFESEVSELKDEGGYDFQEMTRIRRQTAVAKLPQFMQYVNEVLEQKDKILIFAHHKIIIAGIKQALEAKGIKCVKLDGSTSPNAKEQAIEDFQNKKDVRVFIGQTRAAGVGITLTEATDVLFAEQDWTPGRMDQAKKRAHRIGQKDTVFVHNVVFDNSMDAYMAQLIEAKKETIKSVLDAGKVTREDIEKKEEQELANIVPVKKQPIEAQEEEKRTHDEARDFSYEFGEAFRYKVNKKGFLPDYIDAIPKNADEQFKRIQLMHEVMKKLQFKASDRDFAESIANAPKWSHARAAWAYGILHRYRHSLSDELISELGLQPLKRRKKGVGQIIDKPSTGAEKKGVQEKVIDSPIFKDPDKRREQLEAIQLGLQNLDSLDFSPEEKNDVGFSGSTRSSGKYYAHHHEFHNPDHMTEADWIAAWEVVRIHQGQLDSDLLRRAGVLTEEEKIAAEQKKIVQKITSEIQKHKPVASMTDEELKAEFEAYPKKKGKPPARKTELKKELENRGHREKELKFTRINPGMYRTKTVVEFDGKKHNVEVTIGQQEKSSHHTATSPRWYFAVTSPSGGTIEPGDMYSTKKEVVDALKYAVEHGYTGTKYGWVIVEKSKEAEVENKTDDTITGIGPIHAAKGTGEHVRMVTLNNGTEFPVDASIASMIKRINDAGFESMQSMSGLKEDYIGTKGESRYSSDGYVSFVAEKLSKKQIDRIAIAAKKAGLVFSDTGRVFGQKSIDVRTGVTESGKSEEDLLNAAGIAAAKSMGAKEDEIELPGTRDTIVGMNVGGLSDYGRSNIASRSGMSYDEVFYKYLRIRAKMISDMKSKDPNISDSEIGKRWKKFETYLLDSEEQEKSSIKEAVKPSTVADTSRPKNPKRYRYFTSGSNRVGEILGFDDAQVDLGVTADQVIGRASEEAIKRLGGTNRRIFIDSGAFSEVKDEFDPVAGGLKVVKPITHEDWTRILDFYDRISGPLGKQAYVVAPDKVSYAKETMERLERYKDRIRKLHDSGVSIIVAHQKSPDSSLAEFNTKVKAILGFDDFIVGIPSNKARPTHEELHDFISTVKPDRVHLLGMGPTNSKFEAYKNVINNAHPEIGEIFTDSVAITSKVGRGQGVKPLTVSQDEARARVAEGTFGEGYDKVDYTDTVKEDANNWLTGSTFDRFIEEISGFSGIPAKPYFPTKPYGKEESEEVSNWKEVVKRIKESNDYKKYESAVNAVKQDVEAWLEDNSNDWVDQALDNAWIRYTADRSGEQRNREGIREYFSGKGGDTLRAFEQESDSPKLDVEARDKHQKLSKKATAVLAGAMDHEIVRRDDPRYEQIQELIKRRMLEVNEETSDSIGVSITHYGEAHLNKLLSDASMKKLVSLTKIKNLNLADTEEHIKAINTGGFIVSDKYRNALMRHRGILQDEAKKSEVVEEPSHVERYSIKSASNRLEHLANILHQFGRFTDKHKEEYTRLYNKIQEWNKKVPGILRMKEESLEELLDRHEKFKAKEKERNKALIAEETPKKKYKPKYSYKKKDTTEKVISIFDLDFEKSLRMSLKKALASRRRKTTSTVGEPVGLLDLLKGNPDAVIDSWARKMKVEGGDHPFTWCVRKATFVEDPKGFCGAVHMAAFGKTPMELKKNKG